MSKKKKKNQIKKETFLSKCFIFYFKALFAAFLIGLTFFLISSIFMFPEPDIEINKTAETNKMIYYEILVSNRSFMDIYNIEISFRFNKNYPVKELKTSDPVFSTGMKAKLGFISMMTLTIGEGRAYTLNNVFPYCSGIIAYSNRLESGKSAHICVLIDKSYIGKKERIFPVSNALALRNNSYHLKYQHKPLGIFSPVSLTQRGVFEFNGEKTIDDNYGVYIERITEPDGDKRIFELEVNESHREQW